MKSIEKYKEGQKALVVHYQSGTSCVEKKTEKNGYCKYKYVCKNVYSIYKK